MAMMAQSVAEILRNHVSLSVEGIDQRLTRVAAGGPRSDHEAALILLAFPGNGEGDMTTDLEAVAKERGLKS
jgi:hypothetical protein